MDVQCPPLKARDIQNHIAQRLSTGILDTNLHTHIPLPFDPLLPLVGNPYMGLQRGVINSSTRIGLTTTTTTTTTTMATTIATTTTTTAGRRLICWSWGWSRLISTTCIARVDGRRGRRPGGGTSSRWQWCEATTTSIIRRRRGARRRAITGDSNRWQLVVGVGVASSRRRRGTRRRVLLLPRDVDGWQVVVVCGWAGGLSTCIRDLSGWWIAPWDVDVGECWLLWGHRCRRLGARDSRDGLILSPTGGRRG